MALGVYCECGKCLSVEEGDAGSSRNCSCGRIVIVPLVEEFRDRPLLLSAATLERRLRRLNDEGALPGTHGCLACGDLKAQVVKVTLQCERYTARAYGGQRFLVIPLLWGFLWATWREEALVALLLVPALASAQQLAKVPIIFDTAVENADVGGSWIRLHLRGERPLGDATHLFFRYNLTGAPDSMRVLLVNRTQKENHAVELKGLKKDQWAEASVDFGDGKPARPKRGDRVDELQFIIPKGAELLLDDVLL